MLKKEKRIVKKEEIDFVFKKGKTKFNKFLGVKYKENNKNTNRFVVIIGKKVSKKAVERNRIKRLIIKIVEKEELKFQKTYDFVFITLPEILNKNSVEIKEQIIKIFQKI